ncbi:lytic murein transglycosylase [Hydrogenovibrio sp. JE_KL2]|uniref:lytic murein transglycosylase n=1 Tax=Hydrogenovibrio sp. JE_KL2 TaxID=2651188 RepID=UPI00128C909D|nr:lytic murein transglycosylase [Hydrogenovibrio sp. JE_KL2]MPQ76808.1 lytic murein transglycosylase [Hydrogenovibrio sp. JE_KL2]
MTLGTKHSRLTSLALRTLLSFFAVLFILQPATASTYTPPPTQNEADFQKWVTDFKKQALKQGISQKTLNIAFKDVHLNLRVLELDRRQPEFAQTFWQYFNRAVTNWRIVKGKFFLKKYQAELSEVTKKYGVPERFLVAFWGMETNFGGYTGNTPIIESLATLSYDDRRSSFFTKELISALEILDQGNVTVDEMKGSWAGAMGQCQFMPSNYLKYAVDGDNSGTKDLWNSLPDVFNSMGNFLEQLGWQRGENWGREVELPKGFDLTLADGKTKHPLAYWQKLGIKLADGRPLPNEVMDAALVLPYDYRGPAFLVYDNYFVIKRWNRSDSYALAVAHLADRLVGRPELTKTQPKDDRSLSHQQIIELQDRLKRDHYDIQVLDGIIGGKTRQAVRNYQIDHNLPPDGYPSYRMLEILRKNQGDN